MDRFDRFSIRSDRADERESFGERQKHRRELTEPSQGRSKARAGHARRLSIVGAPRRRDAPRRQVCENESDAYSGKQQRNNHEDHPPRRHCSEGLLGAKQSMNRKTSLNQQIPNRSDEEQSDRYQQQVPWTSPAARASAGVGYILVDRAHVRPILP